MNADVVGKVSSHTIPEAFNFGQFCNARLITLFTLLRMFRVRITKWRLVLHTRSSPYRQSLFYLFFFFFFPFEIMCSFLSVKYIWSPLSAD